MSLIGMSKTYLPSVWTSPSPLSVTSPMVRPEAVMRQAGLPLCSVKVYSAVAPSGSSEV